MAEVQRTSLAGETTQKFIEFIMMQSQQASLFLGRIPHPQTGQPEVNLAAARLFIDHLEMIREKTRGNLSGEEASMLDSILTDLQKGYAQAASGGTPPAA